MTTEIQSIPVFYREEMIADSHSFSPSASKPRSVVASWQSAGLPIRVVDFAPATIADLELSHDPAYVRGVLSGDLPNGFDNYDPEVARSLPCTTGAMLAAAREALHSGIACAPVSGFHHAHSDHGGGYCTFNGLTVTVARLLTDGAVRRVLILDCDQHFGDGTEQILRASPFRTQIENSTFGRWYHEPIHARAYMERLRSICDRFSHVDLILYQAGADVHVDDPLGGVLTTEQMLARDAMVFAAARKDRVPLAWNLAGGYQSPIDKVLALHLNTMRACAEEYCQRAL